MDGKWTDSDKSEIAKSLAVMAVIQKIMAAENSTLEHSKGVGICPT